MQITLAEEIQGQQQKEARYNGPLVAVGRNPATCQIVFDQKQWPTVSRQHARFEAQNGRWILADSDSTYGTLLDGRLIQAPTEVQVHSRVQFGNGGPVLLVTGITNEAEQSHGAETLVDIPRQAPAPAHAD